MMQSCVNVNLSRHTEQSTKVQGTGDGEWQSLRQHLNCIKSAPMLFAFLP